MLHYTFRALIWVQNRQQEPEPGEMLGHHQPNEIVTTSDQRVGS